MFGNNCRLRRVAGDCNQYSNVQYNILALRLGRVAESASAKC